MIPQLIPTQCSALCPIKAISIDFIPKLNISLIPNKNPHSKAAEDDKPEPIGILLLKAQLKPPILYPFNFN